MDYDFDMDNLDNLDNLDDDELFQLMDEIDYQEGMKQIEEIENSCLGCGIKNTLVKDLKGGILVCNECGTVNSNLIDTSLETRNYDGNSVSRVSMPTNPFLPESSMGTNMACHMSSNIKKLHGWSAMPYREKSRHRVLKQIEEKCRKGGIMKRIEDDAKILYVNISQVKHKSGPNKGKTRIVRGNRRKSLIAACIFFACKRMKETRNTKDIAAMFSLNVTHITKGCKIFQDLLRESKLKDYYEINASEPEHFVKRYCRTLHINDHCIAKAIQIARNIKRLNIATDHTPLSVATGSILLMAEMNGLYIDKKMIAKVAKVSQVTIKKTYDKILKYKDYVIHDELVELIVKKRGDATSEMPHKLQRRYDGVMQKENPEYKPDTDDEEVYSPEYNITLDSDSLAETFENIEIDDLEEEARDMEDFEKMWIEIEELISTNNA